MKKIRSEIQWWERGWNVKDWSTTKSHKKKVQHIIQWMYVTNLYACSHSKIKSYFKSGLISFNLEVSFF